MPCILCPVFYAVYTNVERSSGSIELIIIQKIPRESLRRVGDKAIFFPKMDIADKIASRRSQWDPILLWWNFQL